MGMGYGQIGQTGRKRDNKSVTPIPAAMHVTTAFRHPLGEGADAGSNQAANAELTFIDGGSSVSET